MTVDVSDRSPQTTTGPIYLSYHIRNPASAAGLKPTLEACAVFVYLTLKKLGNVIWIVEQEKCIFGFLKSSDLV